VLARLPFLVVTGRLKAGVQFLFEFLAEAGKGFVLSKPLLHRFQMSDALPLLLTVDALQLLALRQIDSSVGACSQVADVNGDQLETSVEGVFCSELKLSGSLPCDERECRRKEAGFN
jgi:hypothetical protein